MANSVRASLSGVVNEVKVLGSTGVVSMGPKSLTPTGVRGAAVSHAVSAPKVAAVVSRVAKVQPRGEVVIHISSPRTQQVIAHETGVANVIDPLGGSYYVEELTDTIEAQAESIFAHIDLLGDGSMLEGVLRGIENGYSYAYQRFYG